MPFRIALSGLDAASTDLQVTGHNIANSATTGFNALPTASATSPHQLSRSDGSTQPLVSSAQLGWSGATGVAYVRSCGTAGDLPGGSRWATEHDDDSRLGLS